MSRCLQFYLRMLLPRYEKLASGNHKPMTFGDGPKAGLMLSVDKRKGTGHITPPISIVGVLECKEFTEGPYQAVLGRHH